MAPLPKKKLARIRAGLRKASQTITLPKIEKCPKCGLSKSPHTICSNCGYYKNRLVIKPKVALKVTKTRDKLKPE